MKICVKCKEKMTCELNGVGVRFTKRGTHTYYGDKFKCHSCGQEIIICNTTPTESFYFKDYDIFMDCTKEEAEELRRKNETKKLVE